VSSFSQMYSTFKTKIFKIFLSVFQVQSKRNLKLLPN
jgi:hypothetical protein